MINSKLNSLRAEREKNEVKIAKLKETNKELTSAMEPFMIKHYDSIKRDTNL